eukprot:scaffold11506_cov31-Phaeocystis_antarctica.AAC.1
MAIGPRSWSREHRADCGEAHALPVAAARAPLRQQRHLQVDGTLGARALKRGAQLWDKQLTHLPILTIDGSMDI